MTYDTGAFRMLGFAVASGLGIGIAAVDLAAPFGEDSAKFTIGLWLVGSGLVGFALPRRRWRWAFLVGPWLPVTHLVYHGLKSAGPVEPGFDATGLILLPLSLAVCALGVYGGALARRLIGPLSSPAGVMSGGGT